MKDLVHLEVGTLYQAAKNQRINVYGTDDRVAQFYEVDFIEPEEHFVVLENTDNSEFRTGGKDGAYFVYDTSLVLYPKGIGRVVTFDKEYNERRYTKLSEAV